jgi:HSP20 family protein
MTQNWNPFQELIVLQDRMNRLFEDASLRRVSEQDRDETIRADWAPAADVLEDNQSYLIALDLPGVERSELEIYLDDSRLIIKGNRTLPDSARNERPRGRFERVFTVPGGVIQSEIRAEYKDGVLHITLPKRSEQKSQKVEIKIS